MTRVSIATDLPLELFQDDDAAYDWRVIAAEEKMRDERVRVDATGAEKAMRPRKTPRKTPRLKTPRLKTRLIFPTRRRTRRRWTTRPRDASRANVATRLSG